MSIIKYYATVSDHRVRWVRAEQYRVISKPGVGSSSPSLQLKFPLSSKIFSELILSISVLPNTTVRKKVTPQTRFRPTQPPILGLGHRPTQPGQIPGLQANSPHASNLTDFHGLLMKLNTKKSLCLNISETLVKVYTLQLYKSK
eukprot:g67315.t1